MSESIDNKLKDYFYLVRDGLFKIKKEEGRTFFEKADDEYLNDLSRYFKWYNKAKTNPKDMDVSACKSIEFLNSEEFKNWPFEKKLYAFTKSPLKNSITLDDYKNLIQKNKTVYLPLMKSYSTDLIKVGELSKITLDYLDEIDFASWSSVDQVRFLELIAKKTSLGLSDSFSGLLNNQFFKKVSSGAKKELFNIVYKLKEGCDYNIKFSDFGFSSIDEYDLWQSFAGKDFKTNTKAIEILNKLHLDGKLDNLKVDDVKKIHEFTTLPPEQKLLLLGYAKDLKMEHIESIDKISEVGVDDVFFSNDPENPDFLGIIAEKKDGGLTLASLAKSKLPYFAKIKALGYLKINTVDEKIHALRILSYPDGISLLFQNIYENLFSDKENKEELIEKALNQIESMTEDYLSSLGKVGKQLGLNDEDIKEFGELAKKISEEKEKYKGKSIGERISFWAKAWRVIVNIIVIPFLWTETSKKARKWFTKVSEQIISYDFEEKLSRITKKIGITSIIPKTPKKQENKQEKQDKKDGEKKETEHE